MESLFCRSDREIMEMLGLDKPFQARIIRDSIIKGVFDFMEMT